eukprot:jgi/Ulvmu1/10634/UM066_0013.1
MPAGPFETSLVAAGSCIAAASTYFYRTKQTLPFKVSFFLACPVLGSGIILLCQPPPQPQAAASLEAVQVIPPHLRTQQHAAATLDLLNKDLNSQK